MQASKVTINNLNDPFLTRDRKFKLRKKAITSYIDENPESNITFNEFRQVARYKTLGSTHKLITRLLEENVIGRRRIEASNKFIYWTIKNGNNWEASSLSPTIPAEDSYHTTQLENSKYPLAVPEMPTKNVVTDSRKVDITFIVDDARESTDENSPGRSRVSIMLNNIDIASAKNVIESTIERM